MIPISSEQAVQIGRTKIIPESAEPATISFALDFSGAQDYLLDFGTVDQAGIFGIPRTLFFDNSTNPNGVTVTVEGTQQRFTVPPLSGGYYALNCPGKTRISFVSNGGATINCNVAVHNYFVAPVVWYSDGQITPVNEIAVFGPDADGSAPTEPPVLMAGIDDVTGFVKTIELNGQDIRVSVEQSVLPTGAATQATVAAIATSVDNLDDKTPSNFGEYEAVAAGSADQVLGGAGAAGDFLKRIIIQPANVNPGNVIIKDGAAALLTFPGGAASVADLSPIIVDIEAICGTNWNITTGADVSVLAVGQFT